MKPNARLCTTAASGQRIANHQLCCLDTRGDTASHLREKLITTVLSVPEQQVDRIWDQICLAVIHTVGGVESLVFTQTTIIRSDLHGDSWPLGWGCVCKNES